MSFPTRSDVPGLGIVLAELNALVQKLETAQLESRALSPDEAVALDSSTSLAQRLPEPSQADRLELCSFAQRIWAALAQPGRLEDLQVAKCRFLACELFSRFGAENPVLLAHQWALCGRAWTLADEASQSLPCFAEAVKLWNLQPSDARLAEVAAQAFLWAGEAHFRKASYDETFSHLAQARDLICRPQLHGMLDTFHEVCYTQASAHRGAGNAAQAIELLNLALGAAGNSAVSKCRLLRELARSSEKDAAVVHAKQALAMSPSSKERVMSLQVLLEILIIDQRRKGKALDMNTMQEVQMCVQSLAREPDASLVLCLGGCDALLERGMLEAVEEILAILKSRHDLSGHPEQCRVLMLYSLRKAAEALLAEPQATNSERLQRVVAEFEGLAASAWASELRSSAGRLLWSLAGKLFDKTKEATARWIKKAAELISMNPQACDEAANCWASAGTVFRLLGERAEALECARKARSVVDSVDAQLLFLELSCEQLKAGGDASEALSCLEMLQRNPLQQSQAMRAVQAVKGSGEDLEMTALEIFVTSCTKEQQSDCRGFVAAVQLLVHAQAKGPEELCRLLGLATTLAASAGGAGGVLSEEAAKAMRLLVAVAWSKGQEMGEKSQWSWASSMFQGSHRALEMVDGLEADAARVKEFLDVRAWFLIFDATARVEQAKDPKDAVQLQHAWDCLEKAHRICRQSKDLEAKGIGEVLTSALCQRRLLILMLLEFQVQCLLGEAEKDLRSFVDQVVTREAFDAKSLLAMSKIAAGCSCRRLAAHCLREFLRRHVTASAVDYEQVLPAYREILSLGASRNESFPVFEGVFKVLNSADGDKYPKEEVNWFVASAWNNGTHFFRLQQYKWAERWMSKSLALAKFCPGSVPVEKMTKGYTDCLKHCA